MTLLKGRLDSSAITSGTIVWTGFWMTEGLPLDSYASKKRSLSNNTAISQGHSSSGGLREGFEADVGFKVVPEAIEPGHLMDKRWRLVRSGAC
jgi:hypothetical protein